jgi:hypothetical protein
MEKIVPVPVAVSALDALALAMNGASTIWVKPDEVTAAEKLLREPWYCTEPRMVGPTGEFAVFVHPQRCAIEAAEFDAL